MLPPHGALERLREGNRRFAAGVSALDPSLAPARRGELVGGQAPFATVLGCSDSRAPVEIVFDQGLGDLFVIRVAGNVTAPPLIGSVEFAAEHLGTRLVVVMGHSHCGAVQATLDELQETGTVRSPHLRDIVERVRPAVAGLLHAGLTRDALVREAVRANVRAAAEQLRHGSQILEERILRGELLVVGAEYSLETGAVDFFDGVPEGG